MRPRTRTRLERVRDVYRDALIDGSPPTKTVASTLGISHSHAANLVAKARAAGILRTGPDDDLATRPGARNLTVDG